MTKSQEQYGYQRYYPSGNRYIASASNTAELDRVTTLSFPERNQTCDLWAKVSFIWEHEG